MFLLFIFIIIGIGINTYAFREITRCKNKTKDTLKRKVSPRGIIKVSLQKKILESQSFLFFGFCIGSIITVMHMGIRNQFPNNILENILFGGLVLVVFSFGLQLIWATKVSQKIDLL